MSNRSTRTGLLALHSGVLGGTQVGHGCRVAVSSRHHALGKLASEAIRWYCKSSVFICASFESNIVADVRPPRLAMQGRAHS